MSPQPIDSVRGFGVTLRQIFKKPITQQYPEFKRPLYPRFRGRHRATGLIAKLPGYRDLG